MEMYMIYKIMKTSNLQTSRIPLSISYQIISTCTLVHYGKTAIQPSGDWWRINLVWNSVGTLS